LPFRVAKWIAPLVLAASIALLLYAKLTNDPAFDNLWSNLRPLVILLAIWVIGTPVSRRAFAARAYKRTPTLHREISADLNENRFEAEDGEGARTSMTWNNYDRVSEGKRVFVVRGVSRTFSIVFKSSMSVDEVTSVRSLLNQCVHNR